MRSCMLSLDDGNVEERKGLILLTVDYIIGLAFCSEDLFSS